MHRIRVSAVATAVAAATLLVGCAPAAPERVVPPSATPAAVAPTPTPTESPSPETRWQPAAGVETLASGLSAPWSVVPLESGGALISQRDDGQVLELTPDGGLRSVGTVPGVVSGNESGLHGLALLDDDGRRLLYAYHGAADDNRVVRMSLTGQPGALRLGPPEVIVSGIPRAGTHNGGRIGFGPDGMLYIATGDAQQRPSAPDTASSAGKILRVTPDGAAAGDASGSPVHSSGHRNVQGIAWTADGAMWASEFGQNTWDELNRIDAGGVYGWPDVEGTAGDDRFVDPVAQWATADASPSGIAALGATVFVASLRGERLWVVQTEAGGIVGDPTPTLVGEYGRLRDAVIAPDGSLWVLTNNTDGRGDARSGDDLLLRIPLEPVG